MVAVIAALELDDLLAAGVATGHADGVHRRLGARVAEAHEVGAEASLDLLGQRDPVLDREGVARAVRDTVLKGLGEDRVRVAGGEHAEGHVEVDVLVAVRVADARAARIGHEQRVGIVGLERGRDAEGHRLARSREQLGAPRRAAAVLGLLPRADLGDPRPIDPGLGDRHGRPPSECPTGSSP